MKPFSGPAGIFFFFQPRTATLMFLRPLPCDCGTRWPYRSMIALSNSPLRYRVSQTILLLVSYLMCLFRLSSTVPPCRSLDLIYASQCMFARKKKLVRLSFLFYIIICFVDTYKQKKFLSRPASSCVIFLTHLCILTCRHKNK